MPATGQFEKDLVIPEGFHEFRAILNNDWVGTNYGIDGRPGGSNYSYFAFCERTVHFSYDPITHYVSLTEKPREQPEAVTIVGSFQSELGCPGDWLPGCDKTSMEYNELYGIWTDTLDIQQVIGNIK